MRIGILITFIGDFGQKGFYNVQEIGLAKALDTLFDEVIIYKSVALNQEKSVEKIDGCNNTMLMLYPTKSMGINGLIDTDILDKNLDALIYFSDTQLMVSKVYKWCVRNEVTMYPYIGVLESHSTSKFKRIVIDALFQRNVRVYKKCRCFVKTPVVQSAMEKLDVKDCTITPVGLDLSLLHTDFAKVPVSDLKRKYGYQESDKVLLFIGRMTDEKQPLRIVAIFKQLYAQDQNYRLLMVGKGELLEEVKKASAEVEKVVSFVGQIPNKDIWELYRIADAFVNLNQQEIFGMAILEAMYYGCKVVAWKAPGPSFIIEEGKSGFLVESDQELLEKIKNGELNTEEVHTRVVKEFTWDRTAKKIQQVMENIS